MSAADNEIINFFINYASRHPLVSWALLIKMIILMAQSTSRDSHVSVAHLRSSSCLC